VLGRLTYIASHSLAESHVQALVVSIEGERASRSVKCGRDGEGIRLPRNG
jgi:hypothetical protein